MASDYSSLLCGTTIPMTNEKINEVFRFHMNEIDREKPAVITGTDILTYGDLDYKSDVIAAHLITLNSKTTKQPIIGIFMNLSEESIISILAVFKSEACYIPIDPCYSKDQILYAIHKINMSCILTCSCYIEKLQSCIDSKIDVYEISSILESRNESTIKNLSKEGNHQQLACIMFTSGSTAEPKRVKLSHQNLFNVIKWHWRVFPLDTNEKVLAMKSLCCIDSIIEVFPALLKGISVVVVPRNVKSNACFLLQYLKDHEITRTITSPRLLRSILSYLDTNSSISSNLKIKLWISTGEALTKATFSKFSAYFPTSKIVNCYGCTEVTGYATAVIMDEASFVMINDGVLIGEPVDNSDIYIVNDKGELAQVGKKGEIWISGYNVAIGYYEHTSDQFSQNIFEDRKSEHKVLYKTGDYGYIKNGFLYYIGRLESQIEIDGMTIETIEIENALQSICLVNDAVVLHQNSAENFPRLLSFCVFNDENACSEEIAAKLRSVLPSQFIPTIVKVEDLPVLPSGKVDKLLLWKQYQDKVSDKKENEVLSIIKNVIGVDIDNELMSKTLYELGGSSLAIIEILIGLENAGYSVDPIMLNVCTVEVLGTLQKGIDLSSEVNGLDDKFRIQEVSEDVDIKVVSSIIGKSFTTKNYLDVVAKINVEDHFCLMKEMWPNLVKEKYSFVVWNQKNEMVGVMVNTDFFHEPEIPIPGRLLPIILMHEELENRCREKLQKSGKRLLHNVLLATSTSLTAAENVLLVVFMENKLLEHAKQHGFDGVFTINSSQITQAVCNHILNYQEVDDLDVHEYVYNGEKLFADVPAAIKLIASYTTNTNMSSNSESISEYMKKVINDFELIRGKSRQFFPHPFWDIVVITTSDNVQKKAFEIQINSKIDRGELPRDVPYHIISDPPGPKIGSGGSTIVALQSLLMMYGEKLFTFKILLIHAGGQCQRIPSHSILGKLFAPLPMGKPMFQMLELILAMYWPFTKRMNAGVFLVSSDAIITYHLPDEDDSDTSWTFQNCGFTALAHPSTIETGTTHGVYVLPPLSPSLLQKSCFITPCLEVLQKPSTQTMRDKGAVIKSNSNETSDEIVYSDSAFFFSSSIVSKFIDYIQSSSSITCELDAYGDFLQGLGTQASSSYVYNTSNVVEVSDNLIQTRENIYHLLKESALHVVVLQKSNFYHLGTMKEYTENLCNKEIFSTELRLEKNVFSILSVNGLISTSIDGIVMHSCLHPTSTVPKSTIIEFCDLPVASEIGPDSIISGCSAFGEKISEVPLQIPPGCLIHTIAIQMDGINGYVTLAFSRDDDLKKKYPLRDLTNMKYFGKCFSDIPRKIFGCDKYADLFNTTAEKFSLWQAKLFPMQLTMEDSLKVTLNMIENVLNQTDTFEGSSSISIFPRLSMEEILKYRDIDRTIDYRNKLWQKITDLKSESCNEKDSQ